MGRVKYPHPVIRLRANFIIITTDGGCDTCDVLVIDDDEDLLQLLISHLVARGIKGKGITNGKDLVELVNRYRPRLVLLDIMMPIFDGYMLYDIIKSKIAQGGTCVYFISAITEQDVLRHVESTGVTGFIEKPFSFDDIDAVLDLCGIRNAP